MNKRALCLLGSTLALSLAWSQPFAADAQQTVIIIQAIESRAETQQTVTVVPVVEDPLTACSTPQSSYFWTARIAGEARRALIWKPNNQCVAAPVVIYLHGRTGTAQDSENKRDFHTLWPEAYVVYGEGTNHDGKAIPASGNPQYGWQIRFPHIYSTCGKRKDMEYMEALLRHLKEEENIDESRIFLSGHSSGGFFTLSLAELRPGRFRAFAAVASYSSYAPVPAKIKCGDKDTYVDAIVDNLAAAHNLLVSANPAPTLFVFGKEDVTLVRPPNQARLYKPLCNNFSLFQNTILQLNRKNSSGPPNCSSSNFMNVYDRQVFGPIGPNGAETQVQLYSGDHSWPSQANAWVIDYFKGMN